MCSYIEAEMRRMSDRLDAAAGKLKMSRKTVHPDDMFDLIDIPNKNPNMRKAVVIFQGKHTYTSSAHERSYTFYYDIMLPTGGVFNTQVLISSGELQVQSNNQELDPYMKLIKEYFAKRLHMAIDISKHTQK